MEPDYSPDISNLPPPPTNEYKPPFGFLGKDGNTYCYYNLVDVDAGSEVKQYVLMSEEPIELEKLLSCGRATLDEGGYQITVSRIIAIYSTLKLWSGGSAKL